ncbi:uncharacterized protein EI90DRAFT_2508690 [Cantharellus anzutake]|uniref:uncharacterized protein n=1 Tax=Cantharellus anzutake TaxID=1750568 RepID=UPI0019084ED3|nr:uncharacterized protein EI90DRAFT_2508690 [Cantharellus anzutake]KAF8321398.1 hypothetical protein EI90DRAFT_2508690 [Cantharellus anzutake]
MGPPTAPTFGGQVPIVPPSPVYNPGISSVYLWPTAGAGGAFVPYQQQYHSGTTSSPTVLPAGGTLNAPTATTTAVQPYRSQPPMTIPYRHQLPATLYDQHSTLYADLPDRIGWGCYCYERCCFCECRKSC